MFSWSQIFGMIFSGTVVRLAGAAIAVYFAWTFGAYVADALHHVAATLAAVQGK